MTITEGILQQQLHRLQLPYFVQHYPDWTEQAAREAWTHGLLGGCLRKLTGEIWIVAQNVIHAWHTGLEHRVGHVAHGGRQGQYGGVRA